MGVYIPNMDKPKSCWRCDAGKIANCPIWMGVDSSSNYKDRTHPDCPLIEIVVDEPTREVLKDCDRIEVDANCGGTDWVEVVLTGERRTDEGIAE